MASRQLRGKLGSGVHDRLWSLLAVEVGGPDAAVLAVVLAAENQARPEELATNQDRVNVGQRCGDLTQHRAGSDLAGDEVERTVKRIVRALPGRDRDPVAGDDHALICRYSHLRCRTDLPNLRIGPPEAVMEVGDDTAPLGHGRAHLDRIRGGCRSARWARIRA